MKKLLFLCIAVCCMFIFFACDKELQIPQDLNNYNMQLEYDNQNHRLKGELCLDYINKTENVLDIVKFHLYPNAFRENSKTKVVSVSNNLKAYYNGDSYGDINIIDTKVDDEVVKNEIGGEDSNILSVPLNKELFPNDKVILQISFETSLANVNHRLGYGENCVNICNFYPIACVYENGEYVTDLYNSNGDPFYSTISNYEVEFVCDENYIVASSGTQIEKIENDKKIINISAPAIRDFALVVSEKFTKSQIDLNGTIINYYSYDDENVENNLDIMKKCFEFFSQTIGTYPYKQLSVVKTNFVHGGMEYPNIVLISDSILDNSIYQSVIVHEICHQWWYGVVGNNQFSYGWIDEGLTEYSTCLFFDKFPEYNKSKAQTIKSYTTNYAMFVRVYSDILGKLDTSMTRKLNEFNTEPEYVYNIYTKGLLLFATINEQIGDVKFAKCLKNFYKDFSFDEVCTNDVINSFSKTSRKNLSSLFNSWLDGKVVIVELI